jgi:putative tricarboxylic transport membrane protein
MARGDAWSAAALALLAIFALTQALRLEVGSFARPGPGFFPLVLSAALAVVAGALLVRSRRADGVPPIPREATARGRLAATVGALAAYVVLFERLGFVLATVGMLAFLFAALGRYRWPVAVGTALVVTLAAWVLFDTWLHVRLPAGVLGRW